MPSNAPPAPGSGDDRPVLTSTGELTSWLRAWSEGDLKARDRVVEVLYDQLKRCAARLLRSERPGHTLRTTALVNEAYCRLVDSGRIGCADRAHFMGLAAVAMRHVLVDHARARLAAKRGGAWQQIALDSVELPTEVAADVLALSEALEGLAAVDPDQVRLVELRYFGGYSIEETAAILGVSATTVKRDWELARAWLYRALETEQAPASPALSAGEGRSTPRASKP